MIQCPSVVAWLDQFKSETERELAALTLASLRFVTTDDVKSDLSGILWDLVEKVSATGTQVIIDSIFSKEDAERHWTWLDSISPATQPERRILYKDYFPSDVRDEDSGSEKYLDLVVRNTHERAVRAFPKSQRTRLLTTKNLRSLPHPGPVIDLILITDNIGSGKQVIDFLDEVCYACSAGPFQNSTVKIHLISWTSTKAGLAAIRERVDQLPEFARSAPEITSLNITGSFHELENSEEGTQLLEFFRLYGDPNNKKATAGLGFGKAASDTVLLGSSCPNTLPDFLFTNSGLKSYKPLFQYKQVPHDIVEYIAAGHLRGVIKARESAMFLESMRKERLIQAARRNSGSGEVAWRLLLLSVAGRRRLEALQTLHVSYHIFKKAETHLTRLGWITDDFFPTPDGERLVRDFGRQKNYADYAAARHHMNRYSTSGQLPYYPVSLRGVR
jgi:hypothetical protein